MKHNIIKYANLASGYLLINLDSKFEQKSVSVHLDGLIFPAVPVGRDFVSTLDVYSTSPLFDNKKEIIQVEVADFKDLKFLDSTTCYVDRLSDWAVQGKTTLQLQIASKEKVKTIRLGGAREFKIDDMEKTLFLKAASHRCNATLKFEVRNLNSGEIKTLRFPIDQSFKGGKFEYLYQLVEVPIEFINCEVSVQSFVEYLEYIPDGSGDDPFVFILNPLIADSAKNKSKIRPRELGDRSNARGVWLCAEDIFVRSSSNPSIALKIDGEIFDLFPSLSDPVSFISDHGYSVEVQSAGPQDCFLKINGEILKRISLGAGVTTINIPKEYLRGEVIYFEILDFSCSQLLLSIQVLAPRILTPHEIMVKESRTPLTIGLTVRENHRYQGLRRHFFASEKSVDSSTLSVALSTLDQSYETLKIRPLKFPKVRDPDVSVIIPAHNRVEVTFYALCALLVAQNDCTYEVILVDDGSSDETRNLEEYVSGIKVIRNVDPQRFIRACNSGVRNSKGRYVALLNNDTEVTTGWLDELINAFERFENVGLVGSKLLYPDGRLQDAGGLVWQSGTPWNYGHGQNPWEPKFCYARQVDYVSGAALLTTREIWDEVSGLSSYLEPMYFEDTDLAFKLRDAGYKTYFVPSSIVYHFEGATSGTDLSSGLKKYQALNLPKFKRQWAKAFRNFGKEGENHDLEKDRNIVGRVLFIDYTTPREDRDAGSYAARREIELIQSLGYKVTFLPENLAHFGSYTDDLQKTGVEVIVAPFYLSVTDYLTEHAADFDVIYITRYHVAQNTIGHIRTFAPHAKIVLNIADLHFLRELRSGLNEDNPARLESMRRVRDQELDMMKRADLVLSYNEVEHAVITSHTDGQARVMECPWVVKIPPEVPTVESRSGLSFLGSFDHTPNGEGLKWFCNEVMPLMADADIKLSIYGSGMQDDIRSLVFHA